MKRNLKILLIICSLFLVLPAAAGPEEDPGPVTELPTKIDPANDLFLKITYTGADDEDKDAIGRLSIVEAQDAYYAKYKRYWQGLPTSSRVPAADVAISPDSIISHPSDQKDTWIDSSVYVPGALNIKLRVDVYQSPDGHGYVVTAETVLDEVTWRRSINFGPETWRTASWAPIPPLEP